MVKLVVFGAGLAAGVAGVVRVRRVVRSVSGRRAGGSWADGARDFVAAVREGMAERETELREALGVDAGPGAPLTDAEARDLLAHPTAARRA